MKLKLLSRYFGYKSFRPLQEESINNFLNGNDTLVIMPTGGGKSICYQIPALLKDGVLIVISPLISLMKDQVDNLNNMGINADFLNSSLSIEKQKSVIERTENNKNKLLYIAPEKFSNKNFITWLKEKVNISGFAIDEAHCISQWGHDFRKDYQNLSIIKESFNNSPIIALTGSATKKVEKDIIKSLNFFNTKTFQSSFYRNNLTLKIVKKQNMKQKIINLCKNNESNAIIIYCFSRKETENLTKFLREHNIKSRSYHAGLSSQERNLVQEEFMKDNIQVVNATISFGMGIDKPNVRMVIHTHFPKSIESYYQEIGRSGRDGLESECILFWSFGDTKKHEFFINQSENKKFITNENKKLKIMTDYCIKKQCRWNYIISYFDEIPKKEKCGHCDTCIKPKNLFDATEVTQKIISTIIKTNSTFGKMHILKILKGSKEEKIITRRHDKISTWGIEKIFKLNELSEVFEFLIEESLIEKNNGEFLTYRISNKGIDWIKNKESLYLPSSIIEKEEKISKKTENYNTNEKCLDKLKELRKSIADEHKVPSFMIFSDKTLIEISNNLPKSLNELKNISGIGEKKLNDFGEKILSVIKEFINTPKTTSIKEERIEKTLREIENQKSIKEISEKVAVSESTIINYIEILYKRNSLLDIKYLLPENNIFEKINTSFKKHGKEKLKPNFEELEGEIDYNTLKLCRIL
jgi:ATP-dependent DNA helicase RecQ